MSRTTFITIALLYLTLPLAAQVKTISVIGEAKRSATADQAHFSISVSEHGKTYDEAYGLAQQKAYRLTTALIAAGLDSSAIRQSQYSVGDRTSSFFYKDKRDASIKLGVIVKDLKLLTKVFSALNTEKVDYISSVNFDLVEKQKLNEAALNAAVDNARQKAQSLASAQSLHIGNILSIEEAFTSQPSERHDPEMAYFITGGFNAEYGTGSEYQPAPSLPEEITVRKVVKITFELK